LTAQQEKFIIALLSCPGPTEAAEQVGISRATGYNWLNLPHVKAAYEEAKRDMFAFARERLKQGATLAAETLIDSMQHADKYADRIKAAQIVASYIPPAPADQRPTASGLPAELLPYATLDELAALDAIVKAIEERKLQQEQEAAGVRPLRRS
jgi:hypothetical protein